MEEKFTSHFETLYHEEKSIIVVTKDLQLYWMKKHCGKECAWAISPFFVAATPSAWNAGKMIDWVWGKSRRRKNCVQGPGEIVYWARGGKKSGTFHPPPKWVGKYVHEWGENWRGIVLLQIHTYTVYSTVANLFSTSSFFNNNSLRNSDKVDKLNRVWFKRKQKSDLHLNYQLDG